MINSQNNKIPYDENHKNELAMFGELGVLMQEYAGRIRMSGGQVSAKYLDGKNLPRSFIVLSLAAATSYIF